MENYLKKGIAVGTVEMRKFRVDRGDGCNHYLPHYRVVK
jgi:hypothetical protein